MLRNKQRDFGSRPKVLSLVRLAPQSVEMLRREADLTQRPWTETHELADPQALSAEIETHGYGALLIEADFVLEETLAAAPTLRFVGVCRADYEAHVDVKAATARGVMVVFTPRRNAEAVAELTVALMLNLLRPVLRATKFVQSGRWDDPTAGYFEFRGDELGSQIVGIVGLGAIGRRTAALLKPFGCQLLVTDPGLAHDEIESLGCVPVGLHELLARATFLVVHCPAIPDTMGLIGSEALARLPSGARLVATSGGGVVDATAAAQALHSGQLAGAAVDVFDTHPIAPDNPLLGAPKTILLPHIGGATEATVTRYSDMVVRDYLRFLAGRLPINLANREVAV